VGTVRDMGSTIYFVLEGEIMETEEEKKLFPQRGDYFSIYPMSELAIKEAMEDKEYSRVVFRCLGSNETRIACIPESMPGTASTFYGKKILARSDWRIDDINSLLPALGIERE
jgi:hypothetical protein